MENVQLSPEDEKIAEILANAIGRLVESGVEPRDAAGPIVRALIEVEEQSVAA